HHALRRPAHRTAAFWALVGFALYANKGTVLVLPVLCAAEIALARRMPGRLAAAGFGFLVGALPELMVIVQRQGLGWATMTSKAERGAQTFPRAFVDDIVTLAEHRIALLLVWALALGVGARMLQRATASVRRSRGPDVASKPLTADNAAVPLTL